VHLDEDQWQLGKNYAVEVGVLGHTQVSLAELDTELEKQMTAEQAIAASRRAKRYAEQHAAAKEKLRQRVLSERPKRPITPLGLMGVLAEILPPDVAVIEEAVTTTNTTFERLGVLKNTSGYFGHRGWALGWGLGCALGAKLAWPDRPVLALLGEGAAMYGIQGLWSAARYGIGVTFVICNNAQYQILKIGARGLSLPQAMQGEYEGLDLVGPEVDIVGIARSLGVEAHHVEDLEELRERVAKSLADGRPRLFNVPISRQTQSRLNYG
jgi:benzoylformate decarboxylase